MVTYKERYLEGEFGTCVRVGCGDCYVLPTGFSDTPGEDTLKLYCPRCSDVYQPRHQRFNNVDGCNFGTSFAQLMFVTFPSLVPGKEEQSVNDHAIKKYQTYTPKIFGFKVSMISQSGPKMTWLREKI
jgi:casein kinase II subunit beta